jgi:cation diffusion facilitator CzcD-associated flavoprotein CzcO
MAIDLIRRDKCQNFIILEKGCGFGGVWRDNVYPGCCCDIWSHLYSFSFEQNPEWTRKYSDQEEILAYLTGVAEKFGLYKHVRFNTTVEQAQWDENEQKWKTTVRVTGGKDAEFRDSYTITSDFLVSAVGQLNFPSYPNIPGMDDFKGKLMHSARWDLGYELEGMNVAVIGNGTLAHHTTLNTYP